MQIGVHTDINSSFKALYLYNHYIHIIIFYLINQTCIGCHLSDGHFFINKLNRDFKLNSSSSISQVRVPHQVGRSE